MTLRRLLAAACGAALAPAVAGAQVHGPESEPESNVVNAPVLAVGALGLGASYGASATVAATSDRNGADRLFVPVAGPWLALSVWGDCPITAMRCDSATTGKVLLVVDGVVQAASFLTMLDAVLDPGDHHRTFVRTVHHVMPTLNGFAVIGEF